MIFSWDDANREHIAKHGVTSEEAAEVAMDSKKSKAAENDFEALDRLARSITPEKLRPLTVEQRRQWDAAKRGRPKKAPGTKAVPTLITVDPHLLQRADAYAKKTGVSRSQLFSDAIRRRIGGAASTKMGTIAKSDKQLRR